MLYHILYPLSESVSVFNVFRYITFRSVWALLTALIIAIVIGPLFIRFLKRIKFGQYIHEDVKAHLEKTGTPTMGGLFIAFSLVVSVLLWADLTNAYIWLTLLVYLGFGAVGFMDDYLKILRRNNRGLSAKTKFFAQMAVGSVAVLLLWALQGDTESARQVVTASGAKAEVLKFTQLAVPFFKNIQPDIGWLYAPFAVLVLIGASNGVNLTDGLDGLAIGPTVVAAICFAIFIYVAGNLNIAAYLQTPYVPGVGEVAVFCGALMGAGLGFLWYNALPAQLFMGDVGSLSLGGVIGFVAVLCKQELTLIIVGGLFVLESLSVIIQVFSYKRTGKRVFLMAPLHHHFEMKGMPESKIIVRFWILAVLFAIASLSVLKLR